jgi:hypothetical protein
VEIARFLGPPSDRHEPVVEPQRDAPASNSPSHITFSTCLPRSLVNCSEKNGELRRCHVLVCAWHIEFGIVPMLMTPCLR